MQAINDLPLQVRQTLDTLVRETLGHIIAAYVKLDDPTAALTPLASAIFAKDLGGFLLFCDSNNQFVVIHRGPKNLVEDPGLLAGIHRWLYEQDAFVDPKIETLKVHRLELAAPGLRILVHEENKRVRLVFDKFDEGTEQESKVAITDLDREAVASLHEQLGQLLVKWEPWRRD